MKIEKGKILKDLNQILKRSEELSKQMRFEARISNEELEESLRLGLEGQARIDHYNAFMTKYNLHHLIIS